MKRKKPIEPEKEMQKGKFEETEFFSKDKNFREEMWVDEERNSFSDFDGEAEGEMSQNQVEAAGQSKTELTKKEKGKQDPDSGRKKKKRKKIVLAVLIFALILGVSVFAIAKKRQGDAMAKKIAEPISDTVKTGDIGTTVSGTGTLSYEDAEDIKEINGIKIEKVYAEAGDTVKKGDTLASVDKTSVLTAMADLQEEMDALDEKIEDTEDDTDSSTVTAGVSGRVKKIYASSGDKVTSIMESKGALLLLSIDGKMAVDLEDVSGLSVGDSVDVTLSDGDTVTGTVATAEGSGATITVTDKGTDYNDLVSVTNASGKVIGSGNLYIHSALKVTGYSGTVSSVKVSENEWVDAGDSLIKLKNLDHTAEYEEYVSKRQELSDALAEATVLYESGVITADFEGTIQSVTVSDGDTVGESTSSGSASSSATSTGTETSSFNASGVSYSSGSGGTMLAVSLAARENPASVMKLSCSTSGESGMADVLFVSASPEASEGETDGAGESTTAAEATTQTSTQTESTTAVESTTQTESTTTTAADSTTQATTAADSAADASESTTASESKGNSKTTQAGNGKQATGAASGGMTSGTGSSGGSTTSTSGDSSSTTEETSLVEKTAVFTEASNEKMAVTVSVDELDILSLEKGQEAEVSIDAIGTDVFTGTVSEISTVASSTDGGNTKYTATVLLDKTEDMLVGMNASIVITISEATDVLLVPASAVNEEGDSVYVYTQYDSDSGELSGKTEVTTGVSDGNNTEIQSGLSEGDTIYYTQRSTSDSDEEEQSGFPNGMGGGNMGNMGNGGQRPSGNGGMPSGGGFGSGN